MRVLLLVSLFGGCVKPTDPVAAAEPVGLHVALVMDAFDDDAVREAPARLQTQLTEALARRNVTVESVAVTEAFAAVRGTDGRLALIDATPRLLVACAPRFSAQVNGRFRWSVSVTATIEEPRSSRTFTVPVHLLYSNDDESDALSEAAPLVSREVGRLVDDWLSGARR